MKSVVWMLKIAPATYPVSDPNKLGLRATQDYAQFGGVSSNELRMSDLRAHDPAVLL